MKPTEAYTDLRGRAFSLDELDTEERDLLQVLRQYAQDQPDWVAYRNYSLSKVGNFYVARGLSRKEAVDKPLFRIAQDIGSRLAIASGIACPPDYRDELEDLIRTRYRTRREFCEATGIAEDMLSHVLARRKHLAIDTLTAALERIGYTIHIAPRS